MSTETGKIIDAGEYYYYLPEGYDENTAVSFYVHPSDGEGPDRVRDGAIARGCDSILVIPKVNYPLGGNNWKAYLASISNFYKQFEEETGQSLNKKNVSVAGWSESANNALVIARNSQSTGDIKINNIIAIDGPYSGYNTTPDAKELMQTLGAAGGTMIVVSAWPKRTSTWSDRAAELAKNGGTAIRFTLCDGADTGHAWANTLTYRCNVPGIFSGGTINPDLEIMEKNKRIKYTIEVYDCESDGWIELTPEELQAKINSGEIDENAINEALNQALNANEIDTVKSDNEVLQNYIEKIHKSIENSNLHNTSSKEYASTTANPNNQDNIVANFFNSTLQLLGKLAADTNYILSVGSKLQKMDDNLKKRLETLPEPNLLTEGSTEVSSSQDSSEELTSWQKALNIGQVALSGAAIGTLINPGVGTAVGFAVGAVVGAVITFWDDIKGFFNGLGSGNNETDTTPTTAPQPTPTPDLLGTE